MPPEGSTPVYYLTDWPTNAYTDALVEARYLVSDQNDTIAFILEQIMAPPPDEETLRSPFPAGTSMSSYELHDGLLTVNLSGEFTSLSGPALTLAQACLTLSLCALPEVSSVQFWVGGAAWPPSGKSRFSIADFPRDALVLKPVDQKLSLFFIDPETMALAPEDRWVILHETEAMERYVLEGLLGGPTSQDLTSTLPEEAQLLSISTEEEICYVNLAAAFYAEQPPYTHELAIRSVVQSLTVLHNVQAVQFLEEGQIAQAYGPVQLNEPLS